MERTYINAVTPGSQVKIQGFVENLRNKRTMAFLVIRDISGKIQVTLEKEKYFPNPIPHRQVGTRETIPSK